MDIAHRRLHSLRLNSGPLATPLDVVSWLGAVQSQDFAGALWALGLRMKKAVEDDVLRAFNAGEIVRTHVLRPTWHFVAPADLRWLLMVTAPRVHAINKTMYRLGELDAKTLSRCQTIIAKELKGGRHLTREELGQAIEKAGIPDASKNRLTYMVMAAELEGVICSGPRVGKQFTYALIDERVPPAKAISRESALSELARRYFSSRGPASLHDFARWSGLTVKESQAGIESIKAGLESEEIDGQALWFVPRQTPAGDPPRAFLLSVYDEFVAGYKDRSAICAPEYWKILEDYGSALHFIVVVDGQVIGTWRRDFKKNVAFLELKIFKNLSSADRRAVLEAAERYGAFIGFSIDVKWV